MLKLTILSLPVALSTSTLPLINRGNYLRRVQPYRPVRFYSKELSNTDGNNKVTPNHQGGKLIPGDYSGDYPGEGILEKDIPHFLAEASVLAKGKRTSPQPQLQCVGGDAMKDGKYHASQIYMKNKGIDGTGRVIWKHTAKNINKKVEIKYVKLSFEGVRGSGDHYVYPESGIVEYHLDFVNGGISDEMIVYGIVILVIVVALWHSLKKKKAVVPIEPESPHINNKNKENSKIVYRESEPIVITKAPKVLYQESEPVVIKQSPQVIYQNPQVIYKEPKPIVVTTAPRVIYEQSDPIIMKGPSGRTRPATPHICRIFRFI